MTKFSDLKLDPKVLQAIVEAGYENPTPIQAGAIPPALEGRDVLGIAQTGTGKTASFTLPMITLLGRGRARARMPRSLVLCPTRELAAQVAENFDTYAKHTRLTKALLIGGVSFGEQDKLIDRGVDVLIATPGRLLDHFERGKLLLTGVQIMVVDEADRMLDMGFIPDIERIFQLTPFTRQTLFFSATMAPEIERITNTFLHAPERIEVARQATTSETITQKLVEITPTRKDQSAKQKRELLRALIDAEGVGLKNAIIFCNRKTDVDIVAKSLKAHGYDAAPIHGDLDQRVRMATLDGFREGTLRFLVASDVAARGLDIPAVSHVFNFDLPSHAEDYVHRIGRTGRAGREGTAISIGTPADEKYLSAIEGLVKQTLPRAPVPEGFRLSDAAQKPPRPASERSGQRGAPTRSRSRRGAPRDEPMKERAPVAAAAIVEAPPVETAADNRKSSGGAPTAREERGDRREQSRDDRRDRYRDRDRGAAVMGMGEHTPDFLLTSFSDALAATEARMASSPAPTSDAAGTRTQPGDVQPAGEAADATSRSAEGETATTPARRSRSRRGRSGRGAKEVAAEETTATEVPAPETAAAPENALAHDSAAPADAVAHGASAEATPAAPSGDGVEPPLMEGRVAEEAAADVVAESPSQEVTSAEVPPTAGAEAATTDEKPAKRAAKPRAPRSRRKSPKAAEAGKAESVPSADAQASDGAEPAGTAPAQSEPSPSIPPGTPAAESPSDAAGVLPWAGDDVAAPTGATAFEPAPAEAQDASGQAEAAHAEEAANDADSGAEPARTDAEGSADDAAAAAPVSPAQQDEPRDERPESAAEPGPVADPAERV